MDQWLNIGLALLEGIGLIISPCILPILPFILAASLTGSHKRPYGIILGFVVTFALFTYFSRLWVQYTGIDTNIIRYVSYILLLLFGVIMISTFLTEKFTYITSRLSRIELHGSEINHQESGFWSGIGFGCLVAVIWTPCAGPILAAVIVQAILQQTNWSSFFVILAFGLGASIPMLFIALLGRSFCKKLRFFQSHANLLRKMLGYVIVFFVGYMVYSENYSTIYVKPTVLTNQQNKLIDGLKNPYHAPELTGVSTWLNSPPLQLHELKGKVILIDFWTYSCINCIRTLPYLIDWYSRYHNLGFVIIGVHTPEFEFEKILENVSAAVKKDGIYYPVALDNQFSVWAAFQNRYWPAHYLIDKTGRVVYEHFGEGDYAITENNIRYLLGLNALPTSSDAGLITNAGRQTPETYLGFARANGFMSPEPMQKNLSAHYTYPVLLSKDNWALKGDWIIKDDKIISISPNASIKIHFYAGKVYAVMGSSNGFTVHANIKLNQKLIKAIEINQHTLYPITQMQSPNSGVLEIIAIEPGLEFYTFTFGV